MSLSWTKKWTSADDGALLTGAQIGTMQDDIATGIASTVAVNVSFLLDSAAQTVYCVAPITGTVIAAYVNNFIAARGSVYTVQNGSAGVAIASATVASTGVAGSVTSMTLGTVAVTAGGSIGVARTAQGTTGAASVTVVILAS